MGMETGSRSSPLQQVVITSGPTVSVSQFGAVGNGTKDDTAALQSALNYIKANGGTLTFEAKHIYMVSKHLVISGADDFKLDGNGATIKMANGAPAKSGFSILRIEDSDHFAVSELIFDGNRANRSPAEAPAHNVLIRGADNFSFSHVDSINAVTDGFYLGATNPTDRSTYTRNGLFQDCRADKGFRQGMTIVNGENIQLIGGAYTNSTGTLPAAGIDIESNHRTAVPGNHNILIRGVTLSGNDGYGVQLSARGMPTDITIEGSYFSDNGRGGMAFNSARTLIRGNTFEGFSRADYGVIYLGSHKTNSDNVVMGNSFNHIDTGKPVIYVHRYSGTNNKVYSNTFYDIDGPMLKANTTGTTAWENEMTSSPTYPTTSPDFAPAPSTESAPAPSPEPATDGRVIEDTSNDGRMVATANPETVNGHEGADSVSYLGSASTGRGPDGFDARRHE
jgi:hypothetical protein